MEILIPKTFPGDDTVAVLGFSPAEAEALLAAGRAAGCTDLKSVIHGVLDDAIGIGCRILRAEEEEDHMEMKKIARVIAKHWEHLDDEQLTDKVERALDQRFMRTSSLRTISRVAREIVAEKREVLGSQAA